METNTHNRNQLKSYFVRNAIPTESNFADLIDGMLNQKDDGIVKQADSPLSLEAAGANETSQKPVLRLFQNFTNDTADWILKLKTSAGKSGFNLVDGADTSRLFIDHETGEIGVGTTEPAEMLQVNGFIKSGTVAIGGDPTGSPRGNSSYATLGSNNHGSTLIANNLYIDNTDALKIANTHGSMAGAAIKIPGNNRTRQNHIEFWTTATKAVTADAAYGESLPRLLITPSGNIGIGLTNPDANLDITGKSNTANQISLQLRSGNTSSNFESNQITLGYAGSNSYRHTIKTRHHAGQKPGNAIDFYVWQHGTDASSTIGTLHTMSLDGGNVGIGTTNPSAKLEVVGGAIRPAAGNSESAGILFPKDPGGGSGDAAWMRYYARSGEATTFEIGTSNDSNDHIALMASGNVGIGTTNPSAKLQVAGGLTALQQEAWQNITFQNGWQNYGNTYNEAGYFKDSQGIVHLKGLVKNGAIGSVIFNLPAGYRPAERELHVVATNLGTIAGRVDILSDGNVWAMVGNSGWLSLDGITFRAGITFTSPFPVPIDTPVPIDVPRPGGPRVIG